MLTSMMEYVWGSPKGETVDTNNGTTYDQNQGYLYSNSYGEVRDIDDDDDILSVVKSGNINALRFMVEDGMNPHVKDEVPPPPLSPPSPSHAVLLLLLPPFMRFFVLTPLPT